MLDPMKQALLVCGSMLLLSGCFPAFRTIQPKVQFVVQDPAGRPVENATFTFATYTGRRPSMMQVDRYQTSAAGVVSIRKRGKVQLIIAMPDATPTYDWAYCVEKEGYRALAVQWFRPKDRMTVTLEPGS